MSKGSMVLVVFIALLAGFAIGYLVGQKNPPEIQVTPVARTEVPTSPQQPAQQQEEIYKVPVENSWIRGPQYAPVTIIIFSDFQCPFCKRVEETLSQLMKEYKDKIRIIWKHNPLPFHPNARILAEASEAAGAQGKFWEYHDILFENQDKTREGDQEKLKQLLVDFATKLNLNVEQFKQDLESHKYMAKVDNDYQLAQKFGVRGTPYFFINGRLLRGAQPIDQFRNIINEELNRAQSHLNKGIPLARVYDELVKDGLLQAKEPVPQQPREIKRLDPNAVYKIEVGEAPVRGNNKALVTIVEFCDFDCPFCKRVQDTLKQILDNYKDKVRIVFKHNPLDTPYPPRLPRGLHPNASIAAEAAEAAKAQGKFWEMHDLLFEGQEQRREAVGPEQDSKAYLEWIIKEASAKIKGLNVEKLRRDIETHRFKTYVDNDKALAEKIAARGTPHFFINGKRFRGGAAPFEVFKSVIDEAIAEAEKLMKEKGIKPEAVYAEIIKNGATEAVYTTAPIPSVVEPQKPVDIPPRPNAPSKGPMTAKVRIVEFSDFQCPFCAQVAPVIEEVAKYYGNKVRVEFAHFPLDFHRWAFLLAEATLAAHAQGKFWEMHDKIFQNQVKFRTPNDETEAINIIVELAKEIPGLNINKLKEELTSHKYKEEINKDLELGRKIGVGGTPTIYINGVMFRGQRSLDGFKQVIDPILEGKSPQANLGGGPIPLRPELFVKKLPQLPLNKAFQKVIPVAKATQ